MAGAQSSSTVTPINGNTSGMGELAVVPPEVNGWNWGAFFLTWIWGIGNSTYVSFLTFVPLVSIAMPFVLGAKGNAWAWRNKRWDSVEHFQSTQRGWAVGGLAMNGIAIFLICGLVFSMFTMVGTALGSSVVYKAAVERAEKNPDVQAVLGTPVKPGFGFIGTFDESETVGKVDFHFPINGPKGSGQVYLVAAKTNSKWTVRTLEFLPISGVPIDLRTKDEQDNSGNPMVEVSPDSDTRAVPGQLDGRPTKDSQTRKPDIKPDSNI